MSKIANRGSMVLSLLCRGQARILLGEVARRFYSTERALALRRDLDVPFETPAAKIPLTIRPLAKEDIHELLDDYDDEATDEMSTIEEFFAEKTEIMKRN